MATMGIVCVMTSGVKWIARRVFRTGQEGGGARHMSCHLVHDKFAYSVSMGKTAADVDRTRTGRGAHDRI
eukprot:gene23513-biopygen7300